MTITPLLWLALAGPIALLTVAVVPGGTGRQRAGMARSAALVSLASAIPLAGLVFLTQPQATPELQGAGLYVDALSAIMFLLVSFVGCIVVQYSRNYMAGDAGQARFTRLLCVTLAAVLLLILSGNLVMFGAAWVATSFGLNRLLLFYGDRPSAILAARKKFIASRISDACLIAAFALLWRGTGALDLPTVLDRLSGVQLAPIGVLIALAALLKSAQFPLHGWITEVMETPTPVSALLHAGIVNAGGFLVLRFAPVMQGSAVGMDLLLVIGGITALFASVVMLTQNAVKVALAWSTIAQMGFMLLQCGLGAWPAALLHIVAHSLYKAHAFLSSGSVIDIARASWSPSPGGAPHPARLGLAVAGVLATVAVVGTFSGFDPGREPGPFALGAIMLMGLVHLLAQSIDSRFTGFVVARTSVAAFLVAGAWFGLQAGMSALVGPALPADANRSDPLAMAAIALVVAGFAALTIGQSSVLSAKGSAAPDWTRAWFVHIRNGLYVNTLANRLVLRFWPTGLPTRG
jgi:NAD(P)H-quinone oxidoreductase subunit 5